MNTRQTALLLVTLAITLAAGYAIAIYTAPQPENDVTAQGTTHLTDLAITDNLAVGGTTTSTGAIAADGGLSVDTPAFTVANTSGNVRTAGTLAVQSTTVLTGAVTTIAGITVGGNITMQNAETLNNTLDGEIGINANTKITGTLTASGASTLTGAVTASSTISAASNIGAGGFFYTPPQSIIPADGAPMTPTKSFVILVPAGPVTPTIAACTEGQYLVLYNSAAQNVVLADGGNFILTGDLTLGQYDTVPLVCAAAKWVQIGPVSAN